VDIKLEEVLNIVNEVSRNSDDNELKVIENKELLRNVQNDHLDFIKIVTILKEKSDTLDYVMEQIGDLKQKYLKIVQALDEEASEENKFINKMFDQN